jgi:hypothetical protein
MLFMFANAFVSDPREAKEIDVDDTTMLEFLFGEPVQISDEEDKRQAPVISGAKFWPDAVDRKKEGVEAVTTLVLDIDSGDVPDEAALRDALRGVRAIVYTSPRHRTGAPRWRVLLPLLTPMPPKKHRALVALLSEGLVPGHEGIINVEATGDPTRLGFFGATFHKDEYRWFNLAGARFDWSSYDLQDEVWSVGTELGGLERSPLWTDRATALRAASKRFATYGKGLRPGEGRSKVIWDVAMQLWWAWAAEDRDFVLSVLRVVNESFFLPEAEEELERQLEEAHKRTVGERRQPQDNGTYGWAREPANLIGHATILEHAKRLSRRNGLDNVVVSQALKRLSKGETLSDDVAAWRGLVTKCAHELARAFPTESAERIAQQFAPSLSTMRLLKKSDVPTEGEVYAFVLTRLNSVLRQKEETDARRLRLRERLIDTGSGGERETAYTREELDLWRDTVGLTDHNWLIANKNVVYVFSNGTWIGPFNEKIEFEAQGRKALLAAEEHGFIRTSVYTDTGEKAPIPLKFLLNEYGCCAEVRIDMNVERGYYSNEDKTLVLAGPKRRQLEAKYHEEVDTWFRILSGRKGGPDKSTAAYWTRFDEFDALCDWCASLIETQHPCQALFLDGPANVGKGLFADGCAKLWRAGHIGLEDAFHHFNGLLAETPFILVDEGMPKGMKASDLLRRGIAQREWTFTRKNKDSGKLLGCIRMLFTANNLDVFGVNQDVGHDDVEAIAQRFIHIHVPEESGEYLRSLGRKHHDFVEQNMIAEHCLWLHEKRWASILARGERFLTKAPTRRVADVLATNDIVTGEICAIVCAGLLDKRTPDWLRFDEEQQPLVNAPSIHQMLRTLGSPETTRSLTFPKVCKSLHSVGQRKPSRGTSRSAQQRFWHVSLRSLEAWCRNTDAFSWDDIMRSVAAQCSTTLAPDTEKIVTVVADEVLKDSSPVIDVVLGNVEINTAALSQWLQLPPYRADLCTQLSPVFKHTEDACMLDAESFVLWVDVQSAGAGDIVRQMLAARGVAFPASV